MSGSATAIAAAEGPLFVLVELDVQRPGGAFATAGAAFAEMPHGAPPGAASPAADSTTLRASDLGYVSRATDTPASAVYVPTLQEGFASNRAVDLSPAGSGASSGWGEVRLSSDDRRYDAGLLGSNADQRKITIRIGRKVLDRSRGVWTDPAYSATAELFTGLAQPWRVDDEALAVPVRDQSAWLERPYLQDAFAGTGGANGSADIAGRLKPRLRGGSASSPVYNISPVLIDPVANVWQYTDGAGGIVALYENGLATFGYGGDTTNLWAGTTAAGQYRTDNSKGLFQLGSPNAGQITADAWGQFGGAGAEAHHLANTAALRILRDDMALPGTSFDAASFTAIDGGASYEAGWFWDGSAQEDCATAVGRFLSAINCRMVTKRNGDIACLPLRAVAAGTNPAGSFTTAHIVSLRRLALPADVSPPMWRTRWGYARNHTPMQTGINATVTDTRRQFLRTEDRFSTLSDNAVLNTYRRPNDTPPIPTALHAAADAGAIAGHVMALWSVQRRLYSVELPVSLALRHEVGDVVSLTYPLDDLDAGRLGRVVGEQLRLADATSSLMVLV